MLANSRWWPALSIAVALTALGAAAFSRWQSRTQQQLVERWQEILAGLDEAAAADQVRSLRKHDLLAVAPLTESLADQRTPVAGAARESIGNLIADWKQLPAREAVPRLTVLAEKLADNYASLAPADQGFARQVAQVLLIWPLDDADFPADGLVAQCERILASPMPLLPEIAQAPSAGSVESTEEALPPIVSPQIATRPRVSTVQPAEPIEEPALVTRPPALVSPTANDPPPTLEPEEPRPVQPRQFIRPRVPPIPPAVEP